MSRAALALTAALALAGCGELENPDLGSGTLSGRVQNATASAYLYPLGRADLLVRPAADGRFSIEGVPVETTSLVVVDGPPGSWRAALVPVTVQGASASTVPDVDALGLPLAGRVGAVARLEGGCDSTTTRFTVVGTDQIGVAPGTPGGAAILEPLPQGTFQVDASTGGFATGHVTLAVAAGATMLLDVPLDLEGNDSPGCTAAGASCRAGLVCDPGNGICYECMSDDDCLSSSTGETVCQYNACHSPTATQRELCDPCTADSDCAAGACAADGGFCTRTCTADADCPAGFACRSDGARSVCAPPDGCAEAKESFGAQCLAEACTDHLAGSVCFGAVSDPPLPGYCTAPCDPARGDADCALVPGYTCNTTARVCEKVP